MTLNHNPVQPGAVLRPRNVMQNQIFLVKHGMSEYGKCDQTCYPEKVNLACMQQRLHSRGRGGSFPPDPILVFKAYLSTA